MSESTPWQGANPGAAAGDADPEPASSTCPESPVALDWAHPIVREWFLGKFGTPTEPQEQGWPHILAAKATLISAPTGSGKTLAAFLACIDRLVRKALAGELADRTEVLYVSPLKALGNDIHTNLEGPLGAILQLAGQRGLMMPEIRAAVRTGDTLAPERRAMLAHPPHILVTTPESLYILLTAERSRQILKTVETVIVDEIHAVADDKRGSHLALSLERLDALATRPPVRIGLSATQKPIELVARFLAGSADSGRPEPVVVHIAPRRQLDLAIEVPASELGPVASNEMWDEIYGRIAELVRQHRSTLVFVNTRRLAERVAHHLGEILGEDAVAAHHGSLARKLRLAAERKLKAGELKVLVATASLELGIDIGTVDLVCQIGSPRSIAVALQRIGRAGHWRGAIPKGRLFATTRDELLECAALVRGIRRGELDRLAIPEAPLDVLAQQIVAMCAAEDWKEDDLFAVVRRAYPYRRLPRTEFDAIVEMLSEGIAARRGRYGAYLHRDRVNGRLRGRRGSRLAAITSGGAIPETALYTVVAEPEGTVVGTVDEDFAAESMRGDILLLGNTSWRIRRLEFTSGRVLVEDAHGAAPDVPFWRGEAPARTIELSREVSDLRERISALVPGVGSRKSGLAEKMGLGTRDLGPAEKTGLENSQFHGAVPPSAAVSTANPESRIPNPVPSASPRPSPRLPTPDAQLPSAAAVNWLKEECGLDDAGAEQAVEYIVAGRSMLGAVPTLTTVIAERFFDEGGGMQLVIHAPFGGRINKAWGLALRKRFCRSFNFELQAAATEDGLNISLAEQHSFPLAEVFHFLHPESVDQVLEQAALASPIFTTRWRWDAGRALALLRFVHGKKVPIHIQRMRADDLLASVFPDVAACQENIVGDIRLPDHPLIREVMKDVLTAAMDLDGLKQVLQGIYDGNIHCLAVDTPSPSQFSHQILNANPYAFLDDAPLEERRARAVELRRVLPEAVVAEVGRLDPAAIQQVREEAWPDVRDADELEDALETLVALPEDFGPLGHEPRESVAAAWGHYLDLLAAERRAARAIVDGKTLWVAAARARTFAALYPGAQFASEIAPIDQSQPDREEAALVLVRGWLSHTGPIAADELAAVVRLAVADIEPALLKLEASGSVLRGKFTDGANSRSVGPQPEGKEATLHFRPSTFDSLEWCERRLLARIHRLTLGKLRREIEPVTAAQYMRWLLRWQHAAPGTQLLGERGTLEVVRQLQGFEAPANAWEREILARRIAAYDPQVLDQLCLTGAVGWGRVSPYFRPSAAEELKLEDRNSKLQTPNSKLASTPSGPVSTASGAARGSLGFPVSTLEAGGPQSTIDNRQSSIPHRRVMPTSVAPITFFVREDADWMTPLHGASGEAEANGLSAAARDVLKFLSQRGASFFADMVRGTGRLKSEVETALWELVTAGAITADGFDNLRALIDPKRRAGEGRGRAMRPRHSAGRWSLLYPVETADSARSQGQVHAPAHVLSIEATCWMLLRRYGVVFREVLTRETILPRWRELLIAFRRLEDRGEVRGGRFVSGFLGEQFALPVAVDSLRATRRIEPSGETITVSAADPLNLVGVIVPGERVPALSGRFVSYRDGVPVAAPDNASVNREARGEVIRLASAQ
jgi:ATP-dependent helicase Lhr and Lhr-like helicase